MKKIIFSILMLLPFVGIGQQKDCKALLQEYVNRNNKLKHPTGNQVFYMKVSMSYIMNPVSELPDVNQSMEVIMAQNHLIYESQMASIYQDEKNSFVIVHPHKTIYWNDGSSNPFKETERKKLAAFEDSLLRESTVRTCVVAGDGDKNTLEILLIPGKAGRDKGAESIKVFYHQKEKRIEKVIVGFVKDHSIKYQIVDYHAFSYNFKGFKKQLVYGKVLKADNILHSRYRGYQLIDNRNLN